MKNRLWIDFAKNRSTDHNYTPNLNSDSVVYCYFEKGGKLVSNINVSLFILALSTILLITLLSIKKF